jgi:L-seryl-tRNA(Ser) seleniumtransferase
MAKSVIKKPRDFPSVEELLQSKELGASVSLLPRPVAAAIVRESVGAAKKSLASGGDSLSRTGLIRAIRSRLRQAKRREISRVINATGILVHTNLGRAPLPEAVIKDIRPVVTGYSNLEFDSETGKRGRRGLACEEYLARLAGAEAGTVVNNCAAALFVTLNTLAKRKRVLISRGELVQIGGGFRIPDILRRSGARLAEVGTTNITTLADYEQNLSDGAALILKVHKSNFVQGGFAEEVPLKELVALGRKHQIPVINDLGSGVFLSTARSLKYSEPTVQQSVRAGASLTLFSGDKLLGGPQAGLMVGRAELVAQIKKNPVFRTVRVDKLVFSILERLLTIYLNGSAPEDIRLWSMASVTEAELYQRGRRILDDLKRPAGLGLMATQVYIGGGAMPQAGIPSVALAFSESYRATDLVKKFRDLSPPILGRVENDRLLLDLKAVSAEDIPLLVRGIRKVLAG